MIQSLVYHGLRDCWAFRTVLQVFLSAKWLKASFFKEKKKKSQFCLYFRAASLEGHRREGTWPRGSPPASSLRGQDTEPSGGSWSLKASTGPPRQQVWRVLKSPASASPVQGKVYQGRKSAASHCMVVVEEWRAFLSTKTCSHEVQRLPCTATPCPSPSLVPSVPYFGTPS